MIIFALRWCANALALMATVKLLDGIRVDSLETVALAALGLGLVNTFVRPALIVLTLPLTVFSFGFFTLVINAVLFYAISRLVPGFVVSTAADAFWGSLLFGLFSFILNQWFVGQQPRVPPRGPQMHARRHGKDVIDVEGKAEK